LRTGSVGLCFSHRRARRSPGSAHGAGACRSRARHRGTR
jgi:hypothetical protein